MSMILATQITAVATAVLAIFAIATTVLAAMAWCIQSSEVQRLTGQRAKEAEDQRRAQARRVYIDIEVFEGTRGGSPDDIVVGRIARPPAVTATIHNISDLPIYDARVHWVDLKGPTPAGAEDCLGTVAPGGGKVDKERKVPDGVTKDMFLPVGYFRDSSSGWRWTITPNGYLDPVPAELPAGAPEIATLGATKEAGRLQTLAGS